jgi:hypothetical protein
MRTNKFVASIFAVIFALGTNALAVEYFDFTGWDHSLISSSGQVFTDVVDGVDVTVTSIGSFDGPSTGGPNGFGSFHTDPGSHSFNFRFSSPLELVVNSLTVDSNEVHRIFSSAGESYSHTSGAPASVSVVGTGIEITGNGFGINPTGAAFGTTTLSGAVSNLTLGYQALSTPPNKFGQWQLGANVVVPEPNSVILLAVGVLGMLLQLRRRK